MRSDGETAPASEKSEPDITPESIAAAVKLDPGAMIVSAVIQAFWNPVPVGYTMEHGYQGYPSGGGIPMVPTPQYGPSPLARVATALFNSYGDKIIAAVIEKIDQDVLTTKIADDVYDKLSKEPANTYGARDRLTPAAETVQRMVKEKVAEKLSTQVQADYNAQQEAMLAAWHEKMERDRNRGQIYGGTTP